MVDRHDDAVRDNRVGARIKIIGVGGAGGNAINTMIANELQGVELYAANTDVQALGANLAPFKLPLGGQITRGLGAGGDPEIGRRAAEEDVESIRAALEGADMVFVTAGMGGGTGTGAVPVIARVARELGVLTVGVVTKPFSFEGNRRMRQAEEGIRLLAEVVDTFVVIPNDRLLSALPDETPMTEAFRRCDEVLVKAVRGISDLITTQGLINLDFADVRTVMANGGPAIMGWGEAAGASRAVEAARQAVENPLLDDVSMRGAQRVLVNLTFNPAFATAEVHAAVNFVREQAHEDVNLIFGVVTDETLSDLCRVTLVATSFDHATTRRDHVAEANLRDRPGPAHTEAPSLSALVGAHAKVGPEELRAGKPRRFLGTIVEQPDGEPQLLRKAQELSKPGDPGRTATDDYELEPDVKDDFDIPAFLRRQVG